MGSANIRGSTRSSNAVAPAISTASTKNKRARSAVDDHEGATSQHHEPPAKKSRVSSPRKPSKPVTTTQKGGRHPGVEPISARSPINEIPTEVLAVLMFGGGENGELGLGPRQTEARRPRANTYLDPSDSSRFHVVRLAPGGMHTIALTVDNKIISWGVNDNNALGRGTDWDGGLRDVDAESDDEGELNPHESTPAKINSTVFPPGTKFADVAAGDSCSFALTDTGLVYGWGTFRDPEGKEGFGYQPDGTLIKKQETPTLIRGLQNIVQIACGANHALALDASGNIWAWGRGNQNQFGQRLFGRHQESLLPRIVRVCRGSAKYIACGEYHCFAVDQSDNVWGWGLNSFGQAGDAKSAGGNEALLPFPMKIPGLCGKGVTLLAGGAHHSVAVAANNDCLVWGRIDGGQLGVSFTSEQLEDEAIVRRDDRNKPRICLRPTLVPHVGKVIHAACGTDHTIFVSSDGHAYSTGFGSEGQLGLGSDDDVSVAERIVGKAVKDKTFRWAGAGGQFSVLAGPYVSSP
ncbi:hypothetical protein JDV02_006555 [Purpureocillium takamizusanense]|uniref:RCC1-like domain-containing protein n=1 Tax=Purpureocillium takamizusanense TaxID=2060973 RepID=A0A9Q8QKI2_9HYPO|nr:uncharacterized protein JDV02_006555 [Purpureocillium takamizusanense]UNI20474.1 hypothetical protein JDV02_006555 [Purpureocillium takamizusanense]